MSRYINVNAIEYHEIYEGQEFVRVAYGDDIDNIPTADVVEVVHGKWEYTVTGYPYCSNCDWMPEEDEMLHTDYFCPNCGADMRGEKDGSLH